MLRSLRSWTGSPDTGALIETGIGAVLLIGYGTLVMVLYPLESITRRWSRWTATTSRKGSSSAASQRS
jgi:ABC-type uncharacterized transport system YnjBCD permease subunit